jgi:hypothetical protein
VVLRAIGSCACQANGFWTVVHFEKSLLAPMVSPNVKISSPLCSNELPTSLPRTSAFVVVWLTVALHVGVLLLIVASQAVQSQSPLICSRLTDEPATYVSEVPPVCALT